MFRSVSLLLVVLCSQLSPVHGQTREEKVREDRRKVESEGFWIYNDLDRGFAEARRTGKPLLVVLRCIPCEECVKLDDDLVDQDPVIRPLLEKFVCVRQVSTNGLDLDLFQFDTDQSFAVFMLNADRTIYGRFGTRSHRTEWLGDVSLAGLAKALQGALELHAEYPANRAALAGKKGQPLEFSSPEKYPTLKDTYTEKLDYQGNVVKSCIHCHQIGDAQRQLYRNAGKPIPEKVLWPYPHPKVVGLTLDPKERATVKAVESGSPSAAAGLRTGDRITHAAGQPLLSIADLQWVLHQADPGGARITLDVERNGRPQSLTLNLRDGWRQGGDISWRVSSWGLRRMTTGGLKLAPLDAAERRRLNIPADRMALRVEHVGQYGPHARAKRSGFQKNDIIVRYGDRDDLMTDSALLAWGVTNYKPGQRVPITVLRNNRQQTLQLPMQR